jgi:hypothetical protein
MRVEDFRKLKSEFDDYEAMLLGVKKTEYANDADRLINFKEASQMVGLTPEYYCFVLITKHYHAIRKAVLEGEYNWCWSNEFGEGMKQRIADIRNYMLLLSALIEEKKGDEAIVTEDEES